MKGRIICVSLLFCVLFNQSALAKGKVKKVPQKPKIIGVIGDYLANENNKHDYSSWPLHAMRYQYIDNLVQACEGENVAFVMLTNTSEQADKVAKAVDAIVLTGGDDDPTGRRDKFEKAMVERMLAQKKQVFGICRGMQMINYFMGGEIIEMQPDQKKRHKSATYCRECNQTKHSVILDEGSKLANILGKTEINVNTNHNFAVGKMADGLVITGHSPEDNIPEVMELKNYPKFFLGVQWHPEFLSTGDDVTMLRAFCHAVAVNK